MKRASAVANADPFILLHNGTYYSFGTNHKDGFLAYESDDLITWHPVKNGRDGFVMRKEDVWGEKWFWAPEVYQIGEKFLLYFSAEAHISCAEAASPLGPFVQKEKRPMTTAEEGRIDNHLFIDDDGKGYCFFSRFNDPAGGSAIWAGEVDPEYKMLKEETLFRCIGLTEPWEQIENRVLEGPFVLKHRGKYYLTYSANDCKSHDYAVGYAVADKITGPYIKTEKTPILHRPDRMVGSGHHSFFKDKNGNLRIVFHVHKSKTEMHPREMVIGEACFDGDKLRIGDTFILPVWKIE